MIDANYLDKRIRPHAQAQLDIAHRKMRDLETMEPDELATLTDDKLAALAERANSVADVWESDNIAYTKGYGPHIHRLRRLGYDAARELKRRGKVAS